MASEIALAVVGKIVETAVDPIVNTVVHQFRYIFCYKQNIQTLGDQLDLLEARRDGVQLSVAEAERNLKIVDPTVKLWLTKVDDIKSKAMEVHEGTSNVEKGCLNGWCPNLKHRYILSRKSTKLTARISKLKGEIDKDAKFSHSACPVGIISSEVPSISPGVEGFGFATRIATMNDVMDALTDEKINLIGISGMGGVGKTTLVKQVIEKVKAERLFNEVAMTTVSQQPDLVKIQGEIGEMLGLKLTEGTRDARAKRLCERLKKGGRVLVVLDDIWEGTNLGEVGIPTGTGCTVVFTTRMERACSEMGAQRHIKVEVLSDQEAWDLFQEAAGDCVKNEDIQDIATEVAKACGGLPIAVVTLGKALSKREKYEWEDTLLQLKKASGIHERVKSSIMLSFNFLESRLPYAQALLLLCSLFEEDENIPIEQLVRYSVGLNLFDDVETFEETSNRVHTLVNYLKSSNLLLEGDKDSDLCVKLHDVVRDVCLLIASNPQHAYLVRHDSKLKQWPQNNRKKAHTTIAIKSGSMNELPGGLDYPNLRLLQLQLEHENVKIAGDFFQGMRGLEVFNFEGMSGVEEYFNLEEMSDLEFLNFEGISSYKPKCNILLPPTLDLLTNLQALSLEFCNIGGNLASIGWLNGLKILSFFKSHLDEFPREVGELNNLKLLDLRCQNRSLPIDCSLFSRLHQLEVLYTGHYLLSSINELNSLSSLTTLQICVTTSMIVLELEESFFERLKRFEIAIGCRNYTCGKYGITKNKMFQDGGDGLNWLLHTKLSSLVRRNEHFALENCHDIYIIDDANSACCAFCHLEILEITRCFNVTEIGVGSNFYRLQELHIGYLLELTHLWRGPVQSPSLSNLRVLKIDHCCSLESLFPPNVAKCMVQLEDLQIRDCNTLKGVISNQAKDEDDKAFEYIQFPKLKFFLLQRLEVFKNFFPESCVKDFGGKFDTIQSLFNQWVSFPSLEKIDIRRLDSLEQLVGHQAQDGATEYIRSSFIVNYSTMLQNLSEISIQYCASMEVVFDLDMLTVGEENSPFLFDKLARIYLYELKKLAHVWRMVPDSTQGFRNLKSLICEECHKLRYLLSYSVAKMLVNLQFLRISHCCEIVGVIEDENEICFSEAKSDVCIVFPQLRCLVLYDLKSLRSFCSSKYSFAFPLLDEVSISDCPDMKIFCSGEVKAPMLMEQYEDPDGGEWIWKGNLNDGYYRGKREVHVDDDGELDDDADEVDEHGTKGEDSEDNKEQDDANNISNK